MSNFNVIGKSVLKKDAVKKVTGEAIFANDIYMENMLYGKVLRSKFPHAIIKNIDTKEAKNLPGVKAVLTSKDIPGANNIGIIIKDEPILVDSKVARVGDPIALVAAETSDIAKKALKLIKVDYEELPVVADVYEAMKEDSAKVHGDSNILSVKTLLKGDVDKAFEECEYTIENQYLTPKIAHAFIEPESGIAKYEDGILTFWASTQNPHFDRGEVARMLNLPKSKVRGIQTVTGGGFGGKLDISTQCHTALLAYYTGRPVKITYTRKESMIVSSKRHPILIKYKTGANSEGKLLALDAELLIDTGAYASYGPAVLTRAMVHATGPYEIPNVRIKGTLVYTNNPMCGAMRGFGAPQVAIAYETQMDMLAEKLGISPWEIRLRNIFKPGSYTANNQKLDCSVGIEKTIIAAKKKAEEIFDLKDEGR